MAGSTTKYTKLPKTENLVEILTWRHYSYIVIHFLRNISYAIGDPVMTQYVYAKLAEKEIQNTTLSGGSTLHRGGNSLCSVNKSSVTFKLQQEVQAQAAFWSLYFNIINSIPMVISIVFIGSWADVLGRIPITAYNMTGQILRTVVFAIVIHFNLSTAYLLIGYFIDGAAGGYFGNLVIACAYMADITEKGKQRGRFILIVSNFSHLFYGLVNLGTGYLIRAIGFFWPMVISVILSAILMVALVSMTIETLETRGCWSELHPTKTISRVFGFYYKRSEEDGENVRLKFCVAFLSFITLCQFVLGLWNLEPLYQLNSPFCWDSVKIGIFFGVFSVVQPALSTIILYIVQRWWSEEIIAIFGLVAMIIHRTLQGFAFKSWMLYLAGLIGSPGLLSFAMIRTIVSHLTDPSEQGSVFAGLGTVEALCGMTSSVMLNTIYAHTLLWMKGFVFIVVAISCVIPASLLLGLHFVNKKEKSKTNVELSLDTNTTDSTASQEPEPTLNPAVNAAFEPIDKTF